ncbi:hypothetical protein E1293_45035, partial [Actinomadura darangshiensis]
MPAKGSALPTEAPAAAGRFGRLAAWSQRRRWAALALWVAVVAAITVGSQAAGAAYHNDFALPGTDSQAAADLMTEHGSRQAGATVQIVAEDARGLSGDRQQIGQMLGKVRALPSVTDVGELSVSKSGTIGYATVTLDAEAQDVPKDHVTEIIDTAQAASGDGPRIEFAGDAVRGAEEGGGGGA